MGQKMTWMARHKLRRLGYTVYDEHVEQADGKVLDPDDIPLVSVDSVLITKYLDGSHCKKSARTHITAVGGVQHTWEPSGVVEEIYMSLPNRVRCAIMLLLTWLEWPWIFVPLFGPLIYLAAIYHAYKLRSLN